MSDIVESWTVTDHGVAEPEEVERAIVLLGADDAALAYRVQGYIAADKAEITRLRALLEEAGKVLEPFVGDDGWITVWPNPDAYSAARSFLDKIKE